MERELRGAALAAAAGLGAALAAAALGAAALAAGAALEAAGAAARAAGAEGAGAGSPPPPSAASSCSLILGFTSRGRWRRTTAAPPRSATCSAAFTAAPRTSALGELKARAT